MDSLRQTLLEMAKGADGRSATARLNDIFPEIEQALAAGVRRTAIVAALQNHGISLTLRSFDTAMYRLRKRQAAKSTATVTSPVASGLPSTILPPTEQPATTPSTNLYRPASDEQALPPDWRTIKLTPEQATLLTPAQKKERRKARDALFDPSPYDHPLP